MHEMVEESIVDACCFLHSVFHCFLFHLDRAVADRVVLHPPINCLLAHHQVDYVPCLKK